MDFLIGGVPRSGTSIGGNIFNFHPEGFCYAAETHWIPFLSDVAGIAPVAKGSLPNLRAMFARQNSQVLVEMVRYSVNRGGNPRMLVFDAADIGALTDQAIALLEAGQFGAELCTNAARILREYIHKKVGRPVIGEKTPSNVFAFRDYGALGARVAFMFTREPFAVIRSMQNRGGNAGDRYAAPFRSDLLELIGMYVLYMEAISAARARPGMSVMAYEDMLANSRNVVGEMFAAAGLSTGDRVLDAAARRVRVITPGHAWEHFTPGERALILGLTGKTRSNSPYDEDFFSRLGLDVAQPGEPVAEVKNDVVPMYGVNPPAGGEGGRWLMRDACLAIVHGPSARAVELQLSADFPGSVLAGGSSATLIARDHIGKKEVARLEVRGGGKARAGLSIDLRDTSPLCAGRYGSVSMVEFNSSHAFRPTVNPRSRFGFRFFAKDHRLLSFMLAGHSFS